MEEIVSTSETTKGSSASGRSPLYQLEIPFPPRELSPNSRMHWAAKAKAVKAYREAVGWEAKMSRYPLLKAPVTARCTFYVRDRRRRDLDNLMAMLKPAWDALVDAGILADDSSENLRHTEPRIALARTSFVNIYLEESP